MSNTNVLTLIKEAETLGLEPFLTQTIFLSKGSGKGTGQHHGTRRRGTSHRGTNRRGTGYRSSGRGRCGTNQRGTGHHRTDCRR